MKYVQSLQGIHQSKIIDYVLLSLLLTLNIFQTFSSAFNVNIEQVNIFFGITVVVFSCHCKWHHKRDLLKQPIN